MKVTKRSGKLEDFNEEKIETCAVRTCNGIEDVSSTELVFNSRIKLYDGVTTIQEDIYC